MHMLGMAGDFLNQYMAYMVAYGFMRLKLP